MPSRLIFCRNCQRSGHSQPQHYQRPRRSPGDHHGTAQPAACHSRDTETRPAQHDGQRERVERSGKRSGDGQHNRRDGTPAPARLPVIGTGTRAKPARQPARTREPPRSLPVIQNGQRSGEREEGEERGASRRHTAACRQSHNLSNPPAPLAPAHLLPPAAALALRLPSAARLPLFCGIVSILLLKRKQNPGPFYPEFVRDSTARPACPGPPLTGEPLHFQPQAISTICLQYPPLNTNPLFSVRFPVRPYSRTLSPIKAHFQHF